MTFISDLDLLIKVLHISDSEGFMSMDKLRGNFETLPSPESMRFRFLSSASFDGEFLKGEFLRGDLFRGEILLGDANNARFGGPFLMSFWNDIPEVPGVEQLI